MYKPHRNWKKSVYFRQYTKEWSEIINKFSCLKVNSTCQSLLNQPINVDKKTLYTCVVYTNIVFSRGLSKIMLPSCQWTTFQCHFFFLSKWCYCNLKIIFCSINTVLSLFSIFQKTQSIFHYFRWHPILMQKLLQNKVQLSMI